MDNGLPDDFFVNMVLPPFPVLEENWDEPQSINLLRLEGWNLSFTLFILASAVIMKVVKPRVMARVLFVMGNRLRNRALDSLMCPDDSLPKALRGEVNEVLHKILVTFGVSQKDYEAVFNDYDFKGE